jgi:hypothetical protein
MMAMFGDVCVRTRPDIFALLTASGFPPLRTIATPLLVSDIESIAA